MGLTVKGYRADGGEVALSTPVGVRYKAQIYEPGAVMTLEIPFDRVADWLTRISCTLDGAQLFDGYVEAMEFENGEAGEMNKITARSNAARLAQVQIKPERIFQLSPAQAIEKYAAPYGVTASDLPDAPNLPVIDMARGMSAWNALDAFCRQNFGRIPRIDRLGRVTTNVLSGRSYRVTNTMADGIRYTDMALRFNRKRMLSKVYVKESTFEETAEYSIVVENPAATAAGIVRERYYDPPQAWFPMPERSGRELVKNSMLDAVALTATLVGAHPLYPGDTLEPDQFDGTFYVAEVQISIDRDGSFTRVTAYDLANNQPTV